MPTQHCMYRTTATDRSLGLGVPQVHQMPPVRAVPMHQIEEGPCRLQYTVRTTYSYNSIPYMSVRHTLQGYTVNYMNLHLPSAWCSLMVHMRTVACCKEFGAYRRGWGDVIRYKLYNRQLQCISKVIFIENAWCTVCT